MPGNLLDLRAQLRFYKLYHFQPVNVAIHSVFIPTILAMSAALLHRVPITFLGIQGLTLTHILSVPYCAFYCALCLPTGLLASAILVLLNIALDKQWIHTSLQQEWTVFTAAWIAQFIGHGVFEKRRPALLDNLVQSLVLAPYFIMFELLFQFGFYEDLHQQLRSDVRTYKAQ
ncbi:Mpo1 protein [Maudiozyma humilis]|uniref:Mpo1 protein n=1 Tax=Maudiozyma humilis TaxID=51915 RepID=A0AAV5S260_MAUHU|nr:Mpo1 protein [Kazachstania humilis]